MLHCRSKFYRTRLKSEKDKSVYDRILSALVNFEKRIKINCLFSKNTWKEIADILSYVRLDNPGLFYVDFNETEYITYPIINIVEVRFCYVYDKEQAIQLENNIKGKIDSVIRQTRGKDQYSTELIIYDWLVSNVRYEEKNIPYNYAHSCVGSLTIGKTVCEGYAMAFKLLCDAAGISNIVVFGDVHGNDILEDGGHAWNIVKINGRCYHVDSTWDSCRLKEVNPSHVYFNITDRDMMVDHSWKNNFFPTCNSSEDNFYVKNAILFKNCDYAKKYVIYRLNAGDKRVSAKIQIGLNSKHNADIFAESIINSHNLKVCGRFSMSYCVNIGTIDFMRG